MPKWHIHTPSCVKNDCLHTQPHTPGVRGLERSALTCGTFLAKCVKNQDRCGRSIRIADSGRSV